MVGTPIRNGRRVEDECGDDVLPLVYGEVGKGCGEERCHLTPLKD